MKLSKQFKHLDYLLIGASLIALLFCISWQLLEDDIFWLLRSGKEIIQTYQVPRFDTWSYSVSGNAWVNHGWLSSVFIYGWWTLFKYSGLVLLRDFIILCWFLILFLIFKKDKSALNSKSIFLPAITCILLTFLAVFYRLQLRAESFGLLFYLLILFVHFQPRLILKNKNSLYFILLTLWSNFHSGSVIFGILFCCLIEAENFLQKKINHPIWVFIFPLSLVINPYGLSSLTEIIKHSNYNLNLLWNVEWQPIATDHFRISRHGFSIFSWFFLMLIGATSLYKNFSELKSKYAILGFTAIVTILSFKHIRIFPYSAFLFSIFLFKEFNKAHRQRKQIRALIFVFIFTLIASSHEVQKNWHKRGLGILESAFSTKAFNYIEKQKPEHQLFTDFFKSSYQLWALPDYEVFADPRDVLFDPVKNKFNYAFVSPAHMKAFTEKYKIKTVLLDKKDLLPLMASSSETLFPKTDWGTAFEDESVVVLLKRTGRNIEILHQSAN